MGSINARATQVPEVVGAEKYTSSKKPYAEHGIDGVILAFDLF